jgi:uncharacterized protein YcgL (UPF0745 family)
MVDEATDIPPDTSPNDTSPGADAAGSAPLDSVLCQVFRSPRREGMYLYVDRGEGLARVPEALLQRFGVPEPALVFRLDGERRLARASARDVLNALAEQGFYLQMPPVPGAVTEDGAPGVRPGTPAQSPASPASASIEREDPSC